MQSSCGGQCSERAAAVPVCFCVDTASYNLLRHNKFSLIKNRLSSSPVTALLDEVTIFARVPLSCLDRHVPEQELNLVERVFRTADLASSRSGKASTRFVVLLFFRDLDMGDGLLTVAFTMS